MNSKPRLIAPLPPSVDPKHPEILHWRVSRLEDLAENSHTVNSWLPLVWLVTIAILGLFGLVSPQQAAQLLKFVL